MVHPARRRGVGRGAVLGLAALLFGGMFTLVLAQAQPAQPAKPASKPQPPVAVKGPTSLKLAIVAKDADVGEMAAVINKALKDDWEKNKITPSFYIDDHEFIRRASLDIVGRVANRDDINYFFERADKDSKRTILPEQRRSRYVEYLLKHEDYARHWGNLWANWLLTRAGDFGRGRYHDQMVMWLEDQFAQNKPYNEIVTKLITAKGSNDKNGAVNFILAHLGEPIPQGKQREEGRFEMVPLTSRITRVFLGVQVQCAQCHAHPFVSSLKQESFWGVNAFLRQVRREGAPPRAKQKMMARGDLTLTDDASVNAEASVYFETRGAKVRMWHAEFLAPPGQERGIKLDAEKFKGHQRREELARLLVAHEQFPRAIVNRMWGLFFGRGFVNPIDDFNDNTPPSHPELLAALADRFKHYNYDLKKLIRWITHSNAYHLSYVANRSNDKPEHETQFSRMVMKALTPEQLFESLMTATARDRGMKPADKKQLADQWLGQLITNFGDDEGNEVNFNGTIVQALLMMNGQNINDAIASPKGTVAAALIVHQRRGANAAIEELYLAALNRRPRPAEVANIRAKMALRPEFRSKDSAKAMYEDLFWALLNSNEFLLNH